MSVRFIPRVSTRLSYSFTALFCTAAISHRLNRDPPVCSNVLLFLLPFHSSSDCIVLARRLPLPHRPLVGDDFLPRRRHVFVNGRFVRLHKISRTAILVAVCRRRRAILVFVHSRRAVLGLLYSALFCIACYQSPARKALVYGATFCRIPDYPFNSTKRIDVASIIVASHALGCR